MTMAFMRVQMSQKYNLGTTAVAAVNVMLVMVLVLAAVGEAVEMGSRCVRCEV